MARTHFPLPLRLGLDALMTVLFVASLGFRISGRAPHEWMGLVLCIMFGIHVAAGSRWFATFFKGSYPVRRLVDAVAILALAAAMVALGVTGIVASRQIFGFSHHFDGEILRRIHCAAAYWGLVLIGIHSGLRWEAALAVLRKTAWAGAERTMTWRMLKALAVLVALYGVWASFDRDMGAKLFRGFSFDFWNPDRPFLLFFANNLAIIGLYAWIAHYARKMSALFAQKHPDAPFGAAYVAFEAGARSFRHTHPTGQHLIVTDGAGLTGTTDGKAEEFKAGATRFGARRASSVGTALPRDRP